MQSHEIFQTVSFEKIVNTSTDVHKIKISKMVDSNIKINDYFTPSLYEVLKSKIN